MRSLRDTRTFNRREQLAEGWYWALRSRELARGQVKAVRLLGKDLAIYRGEDGKAVALDAHCPHMGAHLAEGKVDGNGVRCFFHAWKFDASGRCVDVPCMDEPANAELRSWPCEERYGLVWVWTGPEARQPLPYVPDLENEEPDVILGNRFVKMCHPNVVMINAIDAQHFDSVHHLPVKLDMEPREVNENGITFSNTTRVPESNALTRFMGRFYAGPLTYSMCYWYGSTGSVTVGPDFFHFHIIFALRQTDEGHAEGQTILITRKRRGVLGWLVNRVALFLSKLVGDYFAMGDTRVFQTIKFDFKTPIKADLAIVRFIKHLEAQRPVRWGSWEPSPSVLPIVSGDAVERGVV